MTLSLLSPDDLDDHFVPRFRRAVAAIPVAAEAVLYEEDTGELHRLDAVAAIVCSRFDGATSIGAAVDELVAAYGAPRDVVRADVLEMARELGRLGLLAGVQGAPPRADAADHGY